MGGDFIGGIDAGEVLDLASAGFLVEALGVALFTGIHWRIHKHFNELASREQLAHHAAFAGKGRDEGAHDDQARVGEEFAHFTYPADVFYPVVVGKAQIAAQAVAHVVAVQQEGVVTAFVQGDVQGVGDGGFAASAQAGEPEQAGLLVFVGGALSAGDFVVVPDYVVQLLIPLTLVFAAGRGVGSDPFVAC